MAAQIVTGLSAIDKALGGGFSNGIHRIGGDDPKLVTEWLHFVANRAEAQGFKVTFVTRGGPLWCPTNSSFPLSGVLWDLNDPNANIIDAIDLFQANGSFGVPFGLDRSVLILDRDTEINVTSKQLDEIVNRGAIVFCGRTTTSLWSGTIRAKEGWNHNNSNDTIDLWFSVKGINHSSCLNVVHGATVQGPLVISGAISPGDTTVSVAPVPVDRCECGAASLGLRRGPNHSSWCPWRQV